MNIKTEEAKLREEIEKFEKDYPDWKILDYPTIEDFIMCCSNQYEWADYCKLKAKLQQLLTDKKMFQDFVENIKEKLLKTLGMEEER